jgi:transposase-like protein
MLLTRFSGHLLIILRRLKCPYIPNLERHVYPVNFKIKAVELSLRYDVMSKDVAEALDIHTLMLSRWRFAYPTYTT